MPDFTSRQLVYQVMLDNDEVCGEHISCDDHTQCDPGTHQVLAFLRGCPGIVSCQGQGHTHCPQTTPVPLLQADQLDRLEVELRRVVDAIPEIKDVLRRVDQRGLNAQERESVFGTVQKGLMMMAGNDKNEE